MKLKGKNILVTGGTGFIGSHLCEELIKQKATVITTYQSLVPTSYFYSQKMNKKVIVRQVDIRNFEDVFNLVTKYRIDFIFHLAAQPLVEVAYDNPRHTLETNINGSINILECVRLYPKIQGVIVASSDKAYGKIKNGTYKETDSLRGDHPYEVSKSSCDLITNAYIQTYHLPAVITRFGNIYGEGDLNFSRIIPSILLALINNEQLQIRSNGKYVRDYLYVKDVVRGYITLCENIKKVKGEAYNFGSRETYSVIDLVHIVEKLLKKKISYKILNTAINEIPYQTLDSAKIKKILGWKQQFTLSKVIPQIYDWYSKLFL